MSFKSGDVVKIKGTDLGGVVTGAAVNEAADYLVKVEYVDAAEETHERFFRVDELVAE